MPVAAGGDDRTEAAEPPAVGSDIEHEGIEKVIEQPDREVGDDHDAPAE